MDFNLCADDVSCCTLKKLGIFIGLTILGTTDISPFFIKKKKKFSIVIGAELLIVQNVKWRNFFLTAESFLPILRLANNPRVRIQLIAPPGEYGIFLFARKC